LGEGDIKNSTLIYFSCGSTKRGAANKGVLTVDDVCHTLLYQLYCLAREDENNVKLLEDCNKVFANPKAKQVGKVIMQSNRDEKLPDFADAFLAIADRLKLCVIIALDEVDCLLPPAQQELASRLKTIVDPPETIAPAEASVKVLVGCRSGTEFLAQMPSAEVDVGYLNKGDMTKKLSDDLRNIPGLTEAEQEEATKTIVDKAGPRFTYVHDIAIPFMREPFQRPLSRRLQSLPEGMNNIYNEALRKMGSNYVDLLRTALTWAMLAPVPLKVEEIMDAYHGTYNNRGPEVEAEARGLTETGFRKSQTLEIEQLRNASGPFLRLEQTTGDQINADTEYTVTLRDAPLLKEFCMHSSDAESSGHVTNGEVCARCKSALNESRTLSISPKEAHLRLALACLRSLNNPVFQRRVTANARVPQWSTAESQQDSDSKELSNEAPAINDEATEPNVQGDAGDEKNNANSDEVGEAPEASKETKDGEIPEAEDAVEGNSDDAKPEDDDGNDSDDSMDEEDRGEINLLKALESGPNEEVSDENAGQRTERYELMYWTYHVRQAEELWTPEERANNSTWTEVMNELDHFVSANPSFFHWWQSLDSSLSPYHEELEALHIAAYCGLTSWAEYCIDKGADPNQLSGTPTALSPLQVAAIRGNSRPMLKLLLEKGADPNTESEGTLRPFHEWMMEDASLEAIKLMLDHGANPTVHDKSNNWTVLHYFAWHGTDVEAFDAIMDHSVDGRKPDINALDNEEFSPLHALLWRREVPKPLLKAFLHRGADVNKDTQHSARPLQMASVFGELEVLQILSAGQSISEIDDDDNDGDSALMQAAICVHPKCLKFLAELGANTNMQNKHGQTALHHAAWQGSIECAQILLDHDAKPNMVDKHNRTPLFSACHIGTLETANLLLETLLEKKVPMTEINMLTKRRRSPLREAAGRGFDAFIEKLIKTAQIENDIASLAINEPDTRKKMTPLHRAAYFRQASCVRLLLDAGADVKCRDIKGKTALVLAYEQWTLASHQSAFEDIISLLIASAPEDAIVDAELVAICAINGSTRLLEQLCDLGADLNRQDRYGWTPLDLARKYQQKSAGRFLKQQAAWAGMLPSRWAPDTRTTIAEDGISVSHTSGERMCVSTDKPLPAGLDTFYFEVTSKAIDSEDSETAKEWGIGFCTIGGQAIRFPGWPRKIDAPSAKSWGYHADNGGLYYSGNDHGNEVATARPYKAGDTVGAGVDLTTGKIWFTWNGERLETGFEGVQGRLFPLLGLVERVDLETNFRGPYVWKADKGKEES
jgi:ankyrin repeat protein